MKLILRLHSLLKELPKTKLLSPFIIYRPLFENNCFLTCFLTFRNQRIYELNFYRRSFAWNFVRIIYTLSLIRIITKYLLCLLHTLKSSQKGDIKYTNGHYDLWSRGILEKISFDSECQKGCSLYPDLKTLKIKIDHIHSYLAQILVADCISFSNI